MDKLESMKLYVYVVETQGFAKAAEVLGLPRSTVSRVIKELETYLGLQLLQRTTRKLSVTAEGQSYYESCKKILNDISAIESSFSGRSALPKGRLKIGMPQSLARHCFMPHIKEFLRCYPELELMLCSSDNIVDLIQEGFDCVIRAGVIEDSTTLVARPLVKFKWSVFASQDYINKHGKPDNLEELINHYAVGYLNHRTGRTTEWFFTQDDVELAIRMKELLVVDDTDAYIQAGIQGIGLIRIASYLAASYLDNGQLIPCLGGYSFDLPLSLVYPQSQHLRPAIRAFHDWSTSILQSYK
ncbi:LysR family transcriptional regulator [Providencia burhodogranariea]|uniref:LysR family transcriptional regulator n=1 Tax=Providencia burhodogranariea DSM 19968 TaxID=1141662 RepID=K8WQP8_9GAMM|nr:LysR family transcriptional regulator [Providencia burhodogranariea]EKT62924.1 LysR family transcriptional regulator [Providencia burhodogranariea DSM 19968]